MSSSECRKISLLLLGILLTLQVCQSADLHRVFAQRGTANSDGVELKKRGFCNGWGGCRGKRVGSGVPDISLPELVRQRQVEDEVQSLLEVSGEPAAEELSRQILSDARMWEAMQQAARRGTNYPLTYNAQ